MMDTNTKARNVHDDDSVFDDADVLLALAQSASTRAAKEEVAMNDGLGIPTLGSDKGKIVVRQPPEGRQFAQH